MNNSKLRELMKKEITPEMQKEFFEIFKDSQLFLSVTFAEGDIKKGFNINYLSDSECSKAIALFTSSEIAEEVNFTTSLYVIYMEDLVEILKQNNECSNTIIAPKSEFRHVKDIDEYTSLWKCVSQLYYQN